MLVDIAIVGVLTSLEIRGSVIGTLDIVNFSLSVVIFVEVRRYIQR